MEDEGSIVKWRKLGDDEYAKELARKLEEELDELDEEVGNDRERDILELADVAEVYELAWDLLDRDEYFELFEAAMEELEKGIDMWEIDPQELLDAKEAKIERMGGFVDKIYIETVSVDKDNSWVERYLSSPEKYPEVK